MIDSDRCVTSRENSFLIILVWEVLNEDFQKQITTQTFRTGSCLLASFVSIAYFRPYFTTTQGIFAFIIAWG